MKKILLLLTCMTGLLHAIPYRRLSSELEDQLRAYRFKNNYITFIQRYVIEAEQKVAIFREVSKITDITDHENFLLIRYIDDFCFINRLTLDNLTMPNTISQQQFQFHASLFLEKIKAIKEAWNLDIDPEIELENTLGLIERVNRDFMGKFQLLNIHIMQRWKCFKESIYLGACGLQYVLFKAFAVGMYAFC